MNISYQTEMIVNIEKSVAEGKVIILSNLQQIYSIFYDLFNQNYIIKWIIYNKINLYNFSLFY